MANKMLASVGVIFGGGIGASTRVDDNGCIYVSLRELKHPVGKLGDKCRQKDTYDNLQVNLIFPSLEALVYFKDTVLRKSEEDFKEWEETYKAKLNNL